MSEDIKNNMRTVDAIPDTDTLYDLAELFKVFGDSTRIRMLSALLENKEMSVTNLAEELNMEQSAISHQFRILRNAGLVKTRREGKSIFYALDDEHVEIIIATGIEHIQHKALGF